MFKINFKKLAICLLLIQTVLISLSISAFAATKVDPNNLIFSDTSWPDAKITYPAQKDKSYLTPEVEQIENLPKITLEQAVGNAIKTVLKVTMYLTIIAIVIAAIYYIISMGKEEDLTKARNIILYLVIGMAIISSAYAITYGLSKFNFFQEDTTTSETK